MANLKQRLGYFFILAAISQAAHAGGELRPLYRGAKAQAMGNAYVSLADDVQALWYNPAGLAGIKQFSFHYLDTNTDLSGDSITTFNESANVFTNFSLGSINAVMGKNIYGRATTTSTMVMPNFALAFIMDAQAALYSQNKALPNLTLGYQNTNGIQAGYGFRLFGRGRRRGRGELRVGFGLKFLWRRGGYKPIPLVEIIGVNRNTVTDLTGNYENGIGADLGVQYLHRMQRYLFLQFGAAYMNIGDIVFNGLADNQKGNLSLGASLRWEKRGVKIIASYDYRNAINDADWRKKNHLGIQIGIPMIDLFAGINQVYFTYGIGFKLWIIQLYASSYAEELGTIAFQDANRRYMFRMNFKIDL